MSTVPLMKHEPKRSLPVSGDASGESYLVEARKRLAELYFADMRPWVVAYSGGKDSTAILQLVYELVALLKSEGRATTKPVYVISSDTRVESPNVARYVADSLHRIETAAREADMPIFTRLVAPQPEESFWGKLIGLGYPSPTRWFRWCTTNMKIRPSRRAIEGITRQYGSVILLLGTRSSESSQRGNAIAARDTNNQGLNRHHEIPNALVATPIVDWTTDQVWEYLYANDPPWGGDHGFMLNLYRQANGGECPVVLDLNTPSCGGSRFGCWTCTVVKEDKSMQGFIQSGEEGLQPLNEFRDWLKTIREDMSRRSPLRRDGKTAGPGPFNAATRMEILDGLLAMEARVGFPLISDDDLQYIQEAWSVEFDYSHTVAQIAARHGREVKMNIRSKRSLAQSDNELLERCAIDADMSPAFAKELWDTVRSRYTRLDRWGARAELETALSLLIEKAVNQTLAADPAHDL